MEAPAAMMSSLLCEAGKCTFTRVDTDGAFFFLLWLLACLTKGNPGLQIHLTLIDCCCRLRTLRLHFILVTFSLSKLPSGLCPIDITTTSFHEHNDQKLDQQRHKLIVAGFSRPGACAA